MGFLYQLPWQSNGGYDGIAKAIISDWQLNGAVGISSGVPFNVTANGDTLNTPSNQQTADLVGEVTHIGEIGASGTYYDPAAWRQPVGVVFGNTGRNSLRGPGIFNMDASLFRAFPIGGARRIEFRCGSHQRDQYPEIQQPDEGERHERQLHAHHGREQRRWAQNFPERQIRLGVRFAF